VLSCLMRIYLVPLSVAEFEKTCCARAVKHFMDMCKRIGALTTNADLTEYVADCAREEEAAENGIPFEEPCQQEDDDVA
jgi:hypothetical protein